MSDIYPVDVTIVLTLRVHADSEAEAIAKAQQRVTTGSIASARDNLNAYETAVESIAVNEAPIPT